MKLIFYGCLVQKCMQNQMCIPPCLPLLENSFIQLFIRVYSVLWVLSHEWFTSLQRQSVIQCCLAPVLCHRDHETLAERMMPLWSNSSALSFTCVKWLKIGFSVSRKGRTLIQLVSYIPPLSNTFPHLIIFMALCNLQFHILISPYIIFDHHFSKSYS
jgi:hypothetical protein